MGRTPRIAVGGLVYHVLNRANNRVTMFDTDEDYRAFLRVLADTLDAVPMRLISYCILPNHWHLVLWPRENDELPAFMQRLTLTHVRRWHVHRQTDGGGHLYQGTYKSFPVETDEHLLVLLRYVERNALRAGLAAQAEDWRWSSLWLRDRGDPEDKAMLSPWPIEIPRDWIKRVNTPQSQAEIDAVHESIQRSWPLGEKSWQSKVARQQGSENPLRRPGRPRKKMY